MSTLRQIRLDNRMSKDDLAQAAKLSRKQITEIEAGRVQPRDSTLWRLADALGVDPSQLDVTSDAA